MYSVAYSDGLRYVEFLFIFYLIIHHGSLKLRQQMLFLKGGFH